jgi:hypothetical protein
MAPLLFDVRQFAESAPFRFTFGRSRSEMRWTDQREMSFAQFADLLSTSPVGTKDGECYTPALFSGYVRRMDQASRIDVVVLDADSGHTLEEIRASLAAKGWRAIIHSTFSHLTDTSLIAAKPADKWLAENSGAPIGAYMVAKRGYLPRVMHGAAIVDEVIDQNNPDNRNYLIKHQPCPKFRIILPLVTPWQAENYENQTVANQKWRERIGALAYALGLDHDQSCVDTSRLFYLPRRRDETQEFLHRVVDGDDCDLWSLPDAERITDRNAQKAATLFDAPPRPSLQAVNANHKTFVSPAGEFVDLTTWAAKYALRFEVVTALKTRAPSVFSTRVSGVKHHLICPNSAEHVTQGAEGTGTFAVNASQLEQAHMPGISSGFVINCRHNGCVGLDRLDHLHALLATGKLGVSDLTDPAFLLPDAPQIDPSALIQSAAKRALKTEPLDTGSNVTPAMYEGLPGVLGMMTEWVLATALKPQPTLTLGCVLAFMASAIGQRVKLEYWNTRPNMYALGIAYSGAGKEHPMSCVKEMARSAGLTEELIGVEEMVSDSGIVNSIAEYPRQLMLVDEASFMINAANSKQAGPHMVGIIGTLLKLYSASKGTYKSKSYADTKLVKIIDQPCASFYGTSTPAGITGALTSADLNNGLLSRMVLFDAGDRDERIRVPANLPVPSVVTDWLTAWTKVSPIQNPLHRFGGTQLLEPRTVSVSDEAKKIVEDFEGEIHDAKLKARKRGKDALYVRAMENALKFALIRACAILPTASDMGPFINESALNVDAETMRWAVDLSRATVERMDAVSDNIADSPFQRDYNTFVKLVRNSGERGMTQRDVSRAPTGRLPKKLLEEIQELAAQAGDLFWITIKTGGRERKAWVHKDHIAVHRPDGMEAEED